MTKRLTSIVLVMLSVSLIITGCGNGAVNKSIKQAKAALESKNYDEAISSLEAALKEDWKHEEANKLYKIVDGYRKSTEALENKNIEEAKTLLDGISGDYTEYPIKNAVDELKSKVDNYYKEVAKVDTYVTEAEKLFNEKKYEECKKYIETNILGSDKENIKTNTYATDDHKIKATEIESKCEWEIIQKEQKVAEEKRKQQEALSTKSKYIDKLNQTGASLSDLAYLYDGGITSNLLEAESRTLKRWDDMLNEIYGVLKTQLTKSEMDALTDKQLEWLTYRDKTAEDAAKYFAGGSFEAVQRNTTLAKLTKERCYELVNIYMK